MSGTRDDDLEALDEAASAVVALDVVLDFNPFFMGHQGHTVGAPRPKDIRKKGTKTIWWKYIFTCFEVD